jgi:hypothetical protein
MALRRFPVCLKSLSLRDISGSIIVLLAKVVDDLLPAGSVTTMNKFYKALCARFTVGSFICDRAFTFNALNITQDPSSFI